MDKLLSLQEAFDWLKFNHLAKTQIDFASMLNVDRSTINRALKGDPKYLSDNLVSRAQALVKQYQQNAEHPISHNVTTETHLVPTIPYRVYKELNVDLEEYIKYPDTDLHMSPAVSQFAKTDCHYFVGSDAMQPYLHQSDVLALKKVPAGAQVINGEIYVVNTKYNGLLARFVYDPGGEFLELKASPMQDRYTTMVVAKADIFNLYRILGLVRTNI